MTATMAHEIIVDNFAGGGGASTGIEAAIGRSVDVAINHSVAAISLHEANHPTTRHYCENVWDVDPREAVCGRPVGLLWASPDCTHFSKAKGGKPRKKEIRGLAWVVMRWAATVRPRVIMLENVEEFTTWGPLDKDGVPVKQQKGRTFRVFVHALQRHGYDVEWRELRACDYGAPTIRKRFFLVARCDGRPITWPEPTHGDPKSESVKSGRLKPWRTAAEIIDWSLPCPSIFERKRQLAENTLRRIARGIQRFVIENPEPFIVKVNHRSDDFRGQSIDRPMQTVTAKNGWGLVTPTLVQTGYGERDGQAPRAPGLGKPLGTVVAGGTKHALVSAFLTKHFGGHETRGANLADPLPTVTATDHNALTATFLAPYHAQKSDTEARGSLPNEPMRTVDTSNRYSLVSSHLLKLRGTSRHGQPVDAPAPTITAGGLHIGEVRTFLCKYYGAGVGQEIDEPLHTVTSKHRFGLVTVEGQDYEIVDIGMRMLEPHELFAAQGFRTSYIIDHGADGKRLSKAQQVALCGNAVPPQLATALVRANLPEMCGLANVQMTLDEATAGD